MSSKTAEVSAARPRHAKGQQAGAIDWDAIHNSVQRILAPIDQSVMESFPSCQVQPGASGGKNLPLFSFRVYRLSQADIEPIVVGVSFERMDSTIRVNGDISGEESGTIYYETGSDRIGIDPIRL